MPSASVVKLEGVPMSVAPWVVSDARWKRIEPLLPRVERRVRFPGRKRVPDRQALQAILFVLYTGIAFTRPRERLVDERARSRDRPRISRGVHQRRIRALPSVRGVP